MSSIKPRELVPNCVLSRRVSFSSFPAVIGKKRKRSIQGLLLVKKAPKIEVSKKLVIDLDNALDEFQKTANLVLTRLNHDPSSKSKISISQYSAEFSQEEIIKGIESIDMRGFAIAILTISTLLGYLARIGTDDNPGYTYGKEFHKLSLFWGTTIESLLVYTRKELSIFQEEATSIALIDYSDFLIAESEEIYFSSLSKILRSGGHKLKSKLKPENIGLLVPGEFLPNHPRELKDSVGLQIAEKSNHLYTWKSAGEQLSSRRKRSSWSTMISRNIRPRNRCNFPSEEIFYSSWDTTFYTVKCEEVLENEYYNQLENSLNNHTKRKQLSMKKIEINKKKKANDTKDSFYFDSFLKRSHSVKDASNRIEQLRKKALSIYWKRMPNKNSVQSEESSANKNLPKSQNQPNSGASMSSSVESSEPLARNSDTGIDSDEKNEKNPVKKEEKLELPESRNMPIKSEVEDIAYDNDVLGLVARPHTVLETRTDLVNYVHSRAVDLSKIQEQFASEAGAAQAGLVPTNQSSGNSQTHVFVPEVTEVSLQEPNLFQTPIQNRRPNEPQTIPEAVSLILEELVYKVCCLVLKSVTSSDDASTSSEDTSDEFYDNIHSEYLNVALAVNLNSVSANVVMSPKPIPQRRKRF